MVHLMFISHLLFVSATCAIEHKTALSLKDGFRAKRLPVVAGAQDYKRLAGRSNAFADKSLLIKEIFEDSHRAFLITCPHSWGKSMNCDMLKTFLEIQLDREGDEIAPVNTTNYQLFVEGVSIYDNVEERFRAPMLIAQHKHIVDKYLGRYPVIRVGFEYSGWGGTFNSFFRGMMACICDAFHQHADAIRAFEDMINDSMTDSGNSAKLQQRLDQFERYRLNDLRLTATDVMYSLDFLIDFVYDRFGVKVIVLIDEYQAQWERILLGKGASEEETQQCRDFYTDFLLNMLAPNLQVEKIVIAGSLPPYEELYSSVFGPVVECNFITGKFMDYYGFTAWEMKEFFKYRRLRVNLKLDEVTFWYAGYRVHNRSDLRLYNPFSVVKMFEMKRYKRWWGGTYKIQNICFTFMNIVSFRERILSLVYGHTVTIQLQRQHLTWKEYQVLYGVLQNININMNVTYDDQYADTALMFLYVIGFLGLDEGSNPSNATYRVKIPNLQSYLFLRSYVKLAYEDLLFLSDAGHSLKIDLYNAFKQFVYNDNTTSLELEEAFGDYITKRSMLPKHWTPADTDYAEILHLFISNWLIDMSGRQSEYYTPLETQNSLVTSDEENFCWRKEVQKPTENATKPSAVLSWDNRTTIIEVQYNKPDVYTVLEKAKTYANIVNEIGKPMRVVKFIGINVGTNGTIQCLAELKCLRLLKRKISNNTAQPFVRYVF